MPLTSWITPQTGGCLLTIKVVPRASKTEIAGVDPAWLRVRLQAPPVEGRANAALVAFLAETLALPKQAVAVVTGDRGRVKRVRLSGLDAATIRSRLGIPS